MPLNPHRPHRIHIRMRPPCSSKRVAQNYRLILENGAPRRCQTITEGAATRVPPDSYAQTCDSHLTWCSCPTHSAAPSFRMLPYDCRPCDAIPGASVKIAWRCLQRAYCLLAWTTVRGVPHRRRSSAKKTEYTKNTKEYTENS